MAISYSRHMLTRRAESTQQLIVFRVLDEWFALPIQVAYKVIPLGQVYGASQKGGVSLTRHQNQEVLVLDLQQRIFGEPPMQPLLTSTQEMESVASTRSPQRHLLLIQTIQGELIGLPLDAPPLLRRVPKSAFTPISSTYLAQGNIRCVSALIVLSEDEAPIFLLNPNQLIQSQIQNQAQNHIQNQIQNQIQNPVQNQVVLLPTSEDR
ncbi:MAG: hypothetical protein Kow00121_25770 [Elainellaceae cyanobacterium]